MEDDKRTGGQPGRRDEVDVVEVAKVSFTLIIKLVCVPEKEGKDI